MSKCVVVHLKRVLGGSCECETWITLKLALYDTIFYVKVLVKFKKECVQMKSRLGFLDWIHTLVSAILGVIVKLASLGFGIGFDVCFA